MPISVFDRLEYIHNVWLWCDRLEYIHNVWLWCDRKLSVRYGCNVRYIPDFYQRVIMLK